MIEQLEMLAESGPKWAQERASMACQIYEQYQGGGLEEFEYQDIMSRLIEEPKIDQDAGDDLDTKALLITAVHQVGNIV